MQIHLNQWRSFSELKSILQEYKIPPEKWDDYISQL